MRHFLLALAGFALMAAAPAQAARPEPAGARAQAAGKAGVAGKRHAAKVKPPAVAVAPIELAADVGRVSGWVVATGDNQGLPFIIVDKKQARLTLFSPAGEPLDQQPVLIGLAVGDHSTPGVGSKNLAELGTAEKTTPAGRFLARFGLAAGKQKVLWVDYANSVALHPIPATANPREQRRQRMLSPVSDDHRITFGCINVPAALYTRRVVPLFRKQGGYVYVLPDALALDAVFPLLGVSLPVQTRTEPGPPAPGTPGTGFDPAR